MHVVLTAFELRPGGCMCLQLVAEASRRGRQQPQQQVPKKRITGFSCMILRLAAGMSTAVTHTQFLRRLPIPYLALHSSPDSSVSVKKHKPRLDELCQERFPQHSRTLIQSWILQGKVLVNGQPFVKAGVRLSPKSDVTIIAEVPKYVCRAGYKLEAAMEHFKCDASGKVALDAGLSTGGFTDCLLQSGAAYVYGVDVGYGQVAEKIRTDKRVNILERTNLRHLTVLPQLVDMVTLDLSFISILMVMPAVCALMKETSSLITLIKPQFEAQRSQVGSGGVVRDPGVHKEVIERVIAGVERHGFSCEGWIESPIKGADGNMEFLACFQRGLQVCSTLPCGDQAPLCCP